MTHDWNDEEAIDASDDGITELLDHAYTQLDGFVEWSERVCRQDTRASQQDCFNIELLLDYLANYYHKSIFDINEYELRWFVFSHYIRKASAEPETEERLIRSISNFVKYLKTTERFEPHDWMTDVLDDSAYYQRRRASYLALSHEDELAWKVGFKEWCEDLDIDLDMRSLLLPDDLGDGATWSDHMGWREATLHSEANSRWQSEREDLIAGGIDFDQMKSYLRISYYDWIDTPQDRLDGLSPAEVITAERLEAPEQAEDSGDEDAW